MCELFRKLWNPRNFKAHVSPHEMLQAVASTSKKRFKITEQGVCVRVCRERVCVWGCAGRGCVCEGVQGEGVCVRVCRERVCV